MALVRPGMQTAVEQGEARVPGDFQRPQKTRGATAALVIIGHDVGIPADAE